MAKQEVDEILFSEFHPEYVKQKEEERRKEREKIRRRKIRMVFLRGLLVIAVVFGIYLCLDVSKVREVIFTGNPYLSEDYLAKLAGVSADSRMPFVVPTYISARMESNPLIEKAEVVADTDRTVRIELTMKKALAYYFRNDVPYIILDNGDELKLEQEYYTAMSSIPFIRDFETEEQRANLIRGLSRLDSQILSGIAEIWPFVETYDPYMYRFVMADGNEVFMSKDGIKLMASYYGIAANVGSRKVCLMINESTNNAYTRSCAELNKEEEESKKIIAGETDKPEPGPSDDKDKPDGGEKPEEGGEETPGPDEGGDTNQEGG